MVPIRMSTQRHVIVIGASTGGLEALQQIVRDLPRDFPAPILVVMHVSADGPNALAAILTRAGPLPATHAGNGEEIKPGRIYIAPADHHLLIDATGRIEISRGPKENRFRPAIDPLFRSAAAVYGPMAIGVILTGYLDDGTSGLWAIRERGGIAIVQHPEDAVAPSMPMSALRRVEVKHIARLRDIAPLLVRLVNTPTKGGASEAVKKELELELKIARENNALEAGILDWGTPSNFACPECHGVLLELKEGSTLRFRCHTGHGYSLDTLLDELSGKSEDALWNAIRALEETSMLMQKVAVQLDGHGHRDAAESFRSKAAEAHRRSERVREVMLSSKAARPDNATALEAV